jgi:hypothetical protein
MKQQRPRARKTKKRSSDEKQPKKSPRIAVGWGRAGSQHRPGLFIRNYLTQHSEGSCADVFHALHDNLKLINRERIEIGDRPIRGCTYNSFARYWHWYKLASLIEPVNRREASIYPFLEERVFYRLTEKGKAEEMAWQDPVRAAHPEFA